MGTNTTKSAKTIWHRYFMSTKSMHVARSRWNDHLILLSICLFSMSNEWFGSFLSIVTILAPINNTKMFQILFKFIKLLFTMFILFLSLLLFYVFYVFYVFYDIISIESFANIQSMALHSELEYL